MGFFSGIASIFGGSKSSATATNTVKNTNNIYNTINTKAIADELKVMTLNVDNALNNSNKLFKSLSVYSIQSLNKVDKSLKEIATQNGIENKQQQTLINSIAFGGGVAVVYLMKQMNKKGK